MKEILHMDWKNENPIRKTLSKLLLNEYLRRVKIWADHLQVIPLAFSDYSALINENIRVSDKDLQIIREKEFPSLFVRKTCEYFLHWEKLKQHGLIHINELPDLYEPLIKFYLRGGYLVRMTGGVDVYSQGAMFFIKFNSEMYKSKEPNLDLSDERLEFLKDKIDTSQ